jgi:hypothetical protein
MKSFNVPPSFNILQNFFEFRKVYKMNVAVVNKFGSTIEEIMSYSNDLKVIEVGA